MDGQLIAYGSFTSAGTKKDIPLRSDFDRFEVINYTQMATTQTTGRGVEFKWQRGFADDAAYMITKQDSSNALDGEIITSGGFTRVDQSVDTPEAEKTGTAITAASPAVCTVTSHGYAVGDRVRVYGSTGMLQIAGYEFTVTAVGGANSFTLGYLDASGFAAAATALKVRRIPNSPIFFPNKLFVTNISQAASAVVTFSVTHNLTVGEKIRLHCSSDYGMEEIDGLVGEVTAVNTSNNTATVDIDSSGFTAFAFPTSATAANGVTPAHAQVIADNPSLTNSGAIDNQAQILMSLAAGADSPAGSSSDVIYWAAYKAPYVNNE